MPLSELTDRAAVFKAIAEYDHVGREVFLERYGFGRSRGYVLRFDGKDYDSKAIAGAAHGYQFPERGPLRSVDFSGGEQTVQRKLEELGFEVVSPSDAWSRDEVERIVEDYFDMLMREARGENYSKTEHRERLRGQLNGRSDGSIEFKHQNISAVLNEFGLPYIRGYKPRSNVQELLREIVRDVVERATDATVPAIIEAFERVDTPATTDFGGVLVDPPAPEIDASTTSRRRPRLPRKRDYAQQDERNRRLGRAGEEWVVEYEKYRLRQLGRADLAEQVDWLADRLGDGTGYDIVSFEIDGAKRYIEVKTTNGARLTPFMVTENEVAASRDHGAAYFLYRVFDFNLAPRLFILAGDLSGHLDLQPADYRARLKARPHAGPPEDDEAH